MDNWIWMDIGIMLGNRPMEEYDIRYITTGNTITIGKSTIFMVISVVLII